MKVWSKNLEIVNIPDSVTLIESHAFCEASALTDVTMGDFVTEIKSGAFKDCTSLKNIKLSNSLTTIEGGDNWYITNGVFSGCTALESIVIPDSVTTIGQRAFYGCSSLKELTIPKSVTSISRGWSSFDGCINLGTITILNPELPLAMWALGRSDVDSEADEPVELLIRGYANSTAQAYAEEYDYKFEVITDGGNDIEDNTGDINGDGVLNLYDVIEIAKSLIGMRTFTDEEKLIADYNHDGVVNLYDAIEVARTLLP